MKSEELLQKDLLFMFFIQNAYRLIIKGSKKKATVQEYIPAQTLY